ncbi:LuxR C-terminal-related transcriptional regulator, partial [Reinekea sp.]
KKEEATNELSLLLPLIQQYSIVASILYLRQWIMPLFEDMSLEDLPEEQAKFIEQLLILYKQRNTSSRRGEEEVPDGLLALGISKKEWRVLQYIIEGKSNDDIAQTMFIAVSTVKTHINNLYKKLSVANRKEAIVLGKELTS